MVSIKGKYHKINQDRAIVKSFPFGSVVALADGLGSLSHSDVGAQAYCDSVINLAEKYQCKIDDMECFLRDLHISWKKKIEEQNLSIDQCGCTALLVVIGFGIYYAFHIGDGVLGIMADDEFLILLEDKDLYFANCTDPMCEEYDYTKWKVNSKSFSNLQGIYLSSDGVELADMTPHGIKDFMASFINEYQRLSIKEAEKDIEGWLSNWPSEDDKTIAFLLRNDEL